MSCLLVALAGCGHDRDPSREPAELERALFEHDRGSRSFYGQLVAGGPHAPFDPQRPRTPDEVALELGIQKAVQSRQDASAPLRLGRLELSRGAYDRALRQLDAAISRRADDPDAWNDLAVAYLTRHVAEGRAWDLVEALDAIEHAAALGDGEEIRLNRALVYSLLHLPTQASRAWDRYLEVGTDPGWIAEAGLLRAPFEEQSAVERWTALRDELVRRPPGTRDPLLERAVDEFPSLSRQWLENEALSRWADQVLTQDQDAAASLVLASELAEALASRRSESLLVGAIEAIERSPEAAAAAHRLFGRAIDAYGRQETAAAGPDFAAAADRFAALDSPMELWARFYLAICVYYRDVRTSEQMFAELLERVDPKQHPSLYGRVHWLLGTLVGVGEGRDEESLEHYFLAQESLGRGSGSLGNAFVHVLLAETYDPLGEIEQGWQHRLQAFESLATSGIHRRIHSMWNEAAQALLRQERHVATGPLLEELIAHAKSWDDHPFAVAEALGQRAWARVLAGREDDALADLAASREFLAQVQDGGDLIDRHRKWLDLLEGMAVAESEPARAIELFEGSLASLDESGWSFDKPRFLSQLAHAHHHAGDEEEERRVLESAIASWETTRGAVDDPSLRIRSFAPAQAAFERLVELHLERGEEDLAFAATERARARFVKDLRAIETTAASVSTPAHVAGSLSAETLLIEFMVLRDRVIAWRIDANSSRLVRLESTTNDLEQRVDRLARDLARHADDSIVVPQLESLFDRLMRPLEVSDYRRLVVVPDLWLSSVPFAALRDPIEGQWLGERHDVSVLPSATFLFHGERSPRETHARAARTRALVVAVPSAPGLDELPGVIAEAEAVAALYDDPILLTGADATKSAFLDALDEATIVHFAGHATANPEAPERSTLWLSPSPTDDGALHLSELWSRDLTGVDLVVLSACETASGRGPSRDALFGLAGGFFGAGADEIVATLWKIDDRAAPDLFGAYHQQRSTRSPRLAASPDLQTSNWAALVRLGLPLEPNSNR